MRRSCLLGCVLLTTMLALGCAGGGHIAEVNSHARPGTGFITKPLQGYNGRYYSVFLPANYNPAQKFPAIMFLHGMGETGSNGKACLNVGLGPEIAKRANTFPFVVIFPQTNGHWRSDDEEKLAIATLEQAKREFSIDPDRVMLTGLSTGGYGCWRIGAKYRDRFAALVPMCGYSYTDGIQQLTTIPIWCWHYTGDWAVGCGNSREMVNKINAAGGHAKLSTPSGMGHDVWTVAYDDPTLYTWMLAQRRTRTASVGGGN